MSVSQNNLNVQDSVELLSYIINVTPELRAEIDLPKQGESIQPIGKIIMGNPVYKNAFLNTINIIGKTVITRNHWENPWRKFTDKGTISYGQQVRDIIVDIANVYDYNNFANRPHDFLKTEIPNVLQTIYEVNYQKFYKTTTSDEQMSMAFETGDLFSLIDEIVNSMFEGMEYDDYLVAKYILARRILDGTVSTKYIENYDSLTPRQIVSIIKGESNKMTFRNPNYNPAGIRKASSFENQFAILDSEFEATVSTEVLATSFFKDEADMKAKSELSDGFGNFDMARMIEIFGKRDENGDLIPGEYLDGFVPFTDEEMALLNTIPCALVDIDFFQNRKYGTEVGSPSGKATDFYNPQTLKRNHWLHEWGIMATSPFAPALVFVKIAPSVTSISVSPSSATVTKGQKLQLSANVQTTGFANKAVLWTQDGGTGAKINQAGVLEIASNYDTSESGEAGVLNIKIDTILETGDKIKVGDLTYTVDASSEDTIAKQITALKAVLNVSAITDNYTIGGSSPNCSLTEKSGKYGLTTFPQVVVEIGEGSSGKVSMTETEGTHAGNVIIVTATSVYDNTKSAKSQITIA